MGSVSKNSHADHGSRKSAIQGNPLFLFKFLPIRCTLWGGPVVMMALMLFLLIISSKKLTEGFTQNTLGSGTSRFALNQMANRSVRLFFLFSKIIPGSFIGFFFSFRKMLYGSQMGNFSTSISFDTSWSRDSSLSSKSGFSGVNITGSHPYSGRYLANFSHRCTPEPALGGQ